ncbi:hypothetical protein ACU686_33675 [Yinghuangia aomiensis]
MTGLGPGGILDPAPGSDDTAEYAPVRSRRSAVRTRTFAIAGVAAVLALGVGGAVVFAPDGGGGKTQNQSQSTKAKAPVVRGDLTVSEELGGVLGFAGTGTIYAQQPESGGGTPRVRATAARVRRRVAVPRRRRRRRGLRTPSSRVPAVPTTRGSPVRGSSPSCPRWATSCGRARRSTG